MRLVGMKPPSRRKTSGPATEQWINSLDSVEREAAYLMVLSTDWGHSDLYRAFTEEGFRAVKLKSFSDWRRQYVRDHQRDD